MAAIIGNELERYITPENARHFRAVMSYLLDGLADVKEELDRPARVADVQIVRKLSAIEEEIRKAEQQAIERR